MNLENKAIILYHGTTSNHLKALENGISLDYARDGTDFGAGFYLTTNKKQAKKWAKDRADNSNFKKPKNERVKGVVLEYKFNSDISTKLNKKHYNETNLEWAKFIFQSRKGIKHDYDVVEGPLADGDKLALLIEDVESGVLNLNDFLGKINKYPYPEKNQISFHTKKAIYYLEYLTHWEV